MVDMEIIYNFLQELSSNNSMEWMKNNKKAYERAKDTFDLLLIDLINSIYTFDNTIKVLPPRDLTFKLNRDTRFSHDKAPYNPLFRTHISKGGKLPIPVGYFISIKPGNSFLGGGLFASMFVQATKSVRDYIVKNEKAFLNVIEASEFKKNFKIEGEKLKNVPKEYNQDHKLAEYLKYKSWYIEYKVKDGAVLKSNNFVKTSLETFKKMKPFNDFLNKALKDFKMPER